MSKVVGFLRLMRPANIVTAVADILAGVAIAGSIIGGISDWSGIVLLALATAGLYGGGVVFNDVFDAALDRVERPERPIPSGLIRESEGAILGILLLLFGIVCAAFVSLYPSAMLAFLIAIAALVYDKWGKHHSFLGPINMGLCRGLNLLLGMSIIPVAAYQYHFLAVVPIVYIAAITMISRGEVHGGTSRTMIAGAVFYLLVISTILYISFTNGYIAYASVFIVAFSAAIFPPLIKAIKEPIGKNIGKAVKFGVLSLILMNASWAAAFGNVYVAIGIVALLPISILLAKLFAVT